MNDYNIINKLLNDIKTMPIEELKEALHIHSDGPIYTMSVFDPYEAIYSVYSNSMSYKLTSRALSCMEKIEFVTLAKELDKCRLVADRLTRVAANDENYNFMLAA